MDLFETARLKLQPLALADADFLLTLYNQADFIRFVGDKQLKTVVDAQHYIRTGPLNDYREKGFHMYKVILKESDEVIGLCGLIDRETLSHVDLGYAYLVEYQRQGFAVEAAQGMLMYAYSVLKLETLLALVHPENIGSIKTLEKLGFHYKQALAMPGCEYVGHLYHVKLAAT